MSVDPPKSDPAVSIAPLDQRASIGSHLDKAPPPPVLSPETTSTKTDNLGTKMSESEVNKGLGEKSGAEADGDQVRHHHVISNKCV